MFCSRCGFFLRTFYCVVVGIDVDGSFVTVERDHGIVRYGVYQSRNRHHRGNTERARHDGGMTRPASLLRCYPHYQLLVERGDIGRRELGRHHDGGVIHRADVRFRSSEAAPSYAGTHVPYVSRAGGHVLALARDQCLRVSLSRVDDCASRVGAVALDGALRGGGELRIASHHRLRLEDLGQLAGGLARLLLEGLRHRLDRLAQPLNLRLAVVDGAGREVEGSLVVYPSRSHRGPGRGGYTAQALHRDSSSVTNSSRASSAPSPSVAIVTASPFFTSSLSTAMIDLALASCPPLATVTSAEKPAAALLNTAAGRACSPTSFVSFTSFSGIVTSRLSLGRGRHFSEADGGIRVKSPAERKLVGNLLSTYRGRDGRECVREMPGQSQVGVRAVAHPQYVRAALLLQPSSEVVDVAPRRTCDRERKHGEIPLHYRKRSVTKIGGRVALRKHRRCLFELESGFERDRKHESSPDGQQAYRVRDVLGNRRGGMRVIQHELDDGGQSGPVPGAPRHRPQRLGEDGERNELGGEGLGCRHRSLVPGAELDYNGGGAAQRAGGLIGNRHRVGATGNETFEHGHDLRGAARLAHADGEEAFASGLAVVQRVEAGGRERYRQAGGELENVAAEDRSMVGRAAGDEDDPSGVARDCGSKLPKEIGSAADEARQHLRLLRHLRCHELALHRTAMLSPPAGRPPCSHYSAPASPLRALILGLGERIVHGLAEREPATVVATGLEVRTVRCFDGRLVRGALSLPLPDRTESLLRLDRSPECAGMLGAIGLGGDARKHCQGKEKKLALADGECLGQRLSRPLLRLLQSVEQEEAFGAGRERYGRPPREADLLGDSNALPLELEPAVVVALQDLDVAQRPEDYGLSLIHIS